MTSGLIDGGLTREVLEFLEAPQLLDTCIRNDNFDVCGGIG